jgi:hypothetical protein
MKQDDEGVRGCAGEERLYVMRVRSPWQGTGPDQDGAWRVSVREGANGVRRLFTDVDDCIEHLYGEFMRP